MTIVHEHHDFLDKIESLKAAQVESFFFLDSFEFLGNQINDK